MIPGDNDGEQIVTGNYTAHHNNRSMLERDAAAIAAGVLVGAAPERTRRRINLVFGIIAVLVVLTLVGLFIGDMVVYGGIPG